MPILHLLAIACLLLSLTACGSTATGNSTVTAADAGDASVEDTDLRDTTTLESNDTSTSEDTSQADTMLFPDVDEPTGPRPQGLLWSSSIATFPQIIQSVARPGGGMHLLITWQGELGIGEDGTTLQASEQSSATVAWLSFDADGVLKHHNILADGDRFLDRSTRMFPLPGGDIVFQVCVGDGENTLLPNSQNPQSLEASSCAIVRTTPGEESSWRTLGQNIELTAITRIANGDLLAAFQVYDFGESFLEYNGQRLNFTDDAPEGRSIFGASAALVRLSGQQGEPSLVQHWSGDAASGISRMLTLSNGDIAVCGRFGGFGQGLSIDFGNGDILEALAPDDDPATDLFFARLTPTGDTLWAISIYSYLNDLASSCRLAELGDNNSFDVFVEHSNSSRNRSELEVLRTPESDSDGGFAWIRLGSGGQIEFAAPMGQNVSTMRFDNGAAEVLAPYPWGKAYFGSGATLSVEGQDRLEGEVRSIAVRVTSEGDAENLREGQLLKQEARLEGLFSVLEPDNQVLNAAVVHGAATLDNASITIDGELGERRLLLWRQTLAAP